MYTKLKKKSTNNNELGIMKNESTKAKAERL